MKSLERVISPSHLSHRGDVAEASPRLLEERVESIEKMVKDIFEVICRKDIGMPVDGLEYRKALRAARNGSPRELQEFLKRTNGEIPISGRG